MTKPLKWPVSPGKAQVSLGIRPVWSESSLYTQWVAKDPRFLHADSEDSDQTDSENSDQTGQMPRHAHCWAHMPFCWFCHAVAPVSFIAISCKPNFLAQALYAKQQR